MMILSNPLHDMDYELMINTCELMTREASHDVVLALFYLRILQQVFSKNNIIDKLLP